MPGHHAKCCVIVSTFIPRCQNPQTDIIVLIGLIRTIIDCLIEGEGVSAIEGRITILLVSEDIFKDHLRNFVDDFCHLNILAVDLTVDFLFFICQEDIEAAVLLYQHLLHQDLQCILNLTLELDAVIIDIADHERCDIVDVGLDLENIFDHEEGLQHIDGEDIRFLMLRIDFCIVIGTDNNSPVAMIQEIFQCVIEQMEGDNNTHLFIFQFGCGLFKEGQHRTLTFRQMLTGSTVCTDGGQHTGQKIELIGNKRIDL